MIDKLSPFDTLTYDCDFEALLANGYMQLKRLSYSTRTQLRQLFKPVGCTRATTVAAQTLSGLLRIPCRTVENTVRQAMHENTGKARIPKAGAWGGPLGGQRGEKRQ